MNQMNQMNVNMNPGVAGPVGGVPMMNNGSTAPRYDSPMNNPDYLINQLNTYIYDYFLKRGHHDCARALVQDESFKLNTEPNTKTSPGNVNGVDGDSMMIDKDGEKIKIPDDLPRPSLASENLQSSFLLDWFSLFWDFFFTPRKKGSSQDVRQYLQQHQTMMRMREQQNPLMRAQPMMPGHMNQMMRPRNGGMVPPGANNLTKTVLQNNTSGISPQQMAQFQQKQQMQLMQQMREQSDMDMNGNRPQSPASADNAPSPSKRPRLADGTVNGQPLAPGGRGQGQGMQGQNPQMAMQNGMAQRAMNPAQFQQFQQGQVAAQQKSMQVYAQNLALHHSRSASNSQGIPNGGMMNPGVMPNQADLVAMPDGQGMYPMGAEYYGANGQMPQVRPGMAGTPNGQHGNHALQDYQMQLMLLEQQNKRRLMMARQEQDTMARDGQPLQGGALPPGTSPQGSRTGASPNPNEQMKRGTPKMPQSGLPGSPSAADLGQNRGSPGSMNLNGGQMPPEMAAQFSFGPGGPNMRPPSSNPSFSGPQMGQPLTANAANRVPSGQWQQGQMPPQHSPATQPQAGTPQDQRGNMPPPQAPPGAGGNAGRAQESPAGGNAPPTPQPPSKAAPKREKKKAAAKGGKKNANAANQATGATPSTEAADPPQTPNPSTPVTPHPPNNTLRGPANAAAGAPPQQTSAPAPPPMVPAVPDQSQQFNDLGISENTPFSLDFSALDNPDILESFDFDTFLNTDADGTGFGFDPNMSYPPDGVETGADGL